MAKRKKRASPTKKAAATRTTQARPTGGAKRRGPAARPTKASASPASRVTVKPFQPGTTAGGSERAAPLFCLSLDGEPLTTPEGRPLCHRSRALLEAIRDEVRARGKFEISTPGLYSTFCTQVEFIDQEPADGGVERKTLVSGVSFRTCAGPEIRDQYEFIRPMHEYLAGHGVPLIDLPQSVCPDELVERYRNSQELGQLVEFFRSRMTCLTPAGRCVVRHAEAMHDMFVFGVMLAEGACTPRQFAEATAALQCVGPAWGTSSRDTERFVRECAREAADWMRYASLAGGAT